MAEPRSGGTMPPYPDRECVNCSRGDRVIVPPPSSIVGRFGVHSNGNICTKWMTPAMFDALSKIVRTR